jgi:hypothetical protein
VSIWNLCLMMDIRGPGSGFLTARELVKQSRWEAPLNWERDTGDETGWRVFTLRGWHGLSDLLDTVVCHISFYEADAFARWRACRLPTEADWESIASRSLCREIRSMRAGYILQRRVGPRASSNCLATAGNGRRVPTRAIPDTNLDPAGFDAVPVGMLSNPVSRCASKARATSAS